MGKQNNNHNHGLKILNNGEKISMRHNPNEFKYDSFYIKRNSRDKIELHGEPKDSRKGYTLVAVIYPRIHFMMGIAVMIAYSALTYVSLIYEYLGII